MSCSHKNIRQGTQDTPRKGPGTLDTALHVACQVPCALPFTLGCICVLEQEPHELPVLNVLSTGIPRLGLHATGEEGRKLADSRVVAVCRAQLHRPTSSVDRTIVYRHAHTRRNKGSPHPYFRSPIHAGGKTNSSSPFLREIFLYPNERVAHPRERIMVP